MNDGDPPPAPTPATSLLASIVEFSDDAIIGKTIGGTITSWNAGAERIFGYGRDEMLGQSVAILLPGDRRLEEANILECVARGETVAHFETKRIRKGGRQIDMSVTISPIKDTAGSIVGASEVARDITPLKAHQFEIQRLSRLYSALSQINQVIVRNSTREAIFRETCEILCGPGGFKAAWIGWFDLQSRELRPVASCGDRQGYLKTLKVYTDDRPEGGGVSGRAYREGRYIVSNSTLDDPSMVPWREALAKYGLLATAAFPIRMSNVVRGTLTVYATEAGFFRDRELTLLDETVGDISFGLENLARQAKLVEQANFLDAAREGIYVTDLDNHVTYWNKGAERIFGWTSAEMIGARTTDLIHEDPETFLAAKRETIEKGVLSVEMQKRTKDGRRITVETHGTAIYGEDGAPKAILVINIDVTARKLLEAQFLRAQRLESIGALAGGIAHDLNNLLAPIMMGVDLLRAGNPSTQHLGVVDIIDRSARRGTDLVKQVLTFARGSEGARILLNVAPIVKEVRAIAENTFPKSISVATEIGRDLWLVVAEPTQVNQVLMNLTVNARDAMPEGGRLLLGVHNLSVPQDGKTVGPQVPPGRYVCIEVSDTGCGMEKSVIEHIFEPFFTTKDLGRGTGLGLSTVMGIVRGSGGFVDVLSEPGKGSTFRVLLPAQDEPEGRGAAPRQIEGIPRGNGELILVVDDEVSILQITRQTLKSFGYRVITAENGAHAIGLYAAEQGSVAAIFTDLVMPIMGGEALIAAARRINPHVVVVAATGAESAANLLEIRELGVSAILSKPYSAEDLLKTMFRALEASRSSGDPRI